MDGQKLVTALSAVTATTTSAVINVKRAKRITLMFTAASISAGNGVFKVSGSIDDSTYIDLNCLVDDVTSTSSQNITRVATSTLNSNISKLYALDLSNFDYSSIKVTVTRTTDGAYSALAFVTY
jgi:hypothetical protein